MTNNNENKVLNVPTLRFTGFTDEWKQSLLKEYLVENKERNTKGVFSKAEVLSVSGDKGIVNQIELLGRSYAGQSVLPYHIVRRNNIVYTKSPLSEFPYGIVKMNRGNDGIVSTLYAVYSVQETAYPSFIEYYFASKDRTNRYFKPIVRIGAKHDMKIGNGEVLANMVRFPSIKEQRRISEFLELIDERIATQNKIIDKLKSLIKGLTVTLTTKGKPNIAISQCLECHSSTLQESEVLPNGFDKVFGANGLVGYTNTAQMNGDAILVIKDGSGVGTVSYAQDKFSVIGTLNYLTAIGNNNLRYLYFALSVFNFQPYRTGMAIPHIYFKDYGKAKIYCPSLTEQKRVANMLGKMESKLFLEQELWASFNSQKRYLLGQMFI